MARIKIKNKNSLPKGFTVRNGKVIKTYAAGGATVSNTLKPVDRKAANLEAEKGEMALTDTSGDGVFELYDIGGKRHTEGGTPLNLPDQSFIYSDTRGMLLTKDEMKSLGIEQKKRITPAKAAKKFPLNKYIETLEDETSDKIAVETAEQMINKNKIMLSQIAFIQESKKDFENGLPLAAFPYLMSKGVDPQQFQAKIDEINASKNPQQSQGMTQGMPPQGMPPQGMMPPQPPTAGQAEEMMVANEGTELQNTPLGKLLFGGFKKSTYSVAPVENTPQDNSAQDDHPPCPAYGNPPPSAAMKHAADINKNYKGPGMMYGGNVEPEAPMDPFPKFQTQGEVPAESAGAVAGAGVGKALEEEPEVEVEFDLATKCKNQLCTYDEWRFAYRLKDIKEVRFMYESYKTKALDKMKASDTDTRIMPGHEKLKNMPYGNMPKPKKQYGGDSRAEAMEQSTAAVKAEWDAIHGDRTNLAPDFKDPLFGQMGTETGQPMVPQMGVPEGYVRDENPLGLPGMSKGGGTNNPGFKALPDAVQTKILSNMAYGGPKGEDAYLARRDAAIKNAMGKSMYGNELKKFVYGGQDGTGIAMERSVDIELDPVNPSYTSNPMYRSLHSQLEMMQMDHSNAIKYHQENPHMFKEKKAQEEFEKQINELQAQMRDVELQMRNVQRKDVLAGSIMDIDQSGPNIQIADPSMYTGSNPAMQGADMMMARQGMELPRMDKGQPICTGEDCNHDDAHDSDKYKGREAGRKAHQEFYNHVMGEDFADVRAAWVEGYRALEKQWADVVANAGGIEKIKDAIKNKKNIGNLSVDDLKKIVKNQPVSGKSEDELFAAYMDMNDKLLQAKHAGYSPNDFNTKDGVGYKSICEEFGWGDCEGDTHNQNAKIFQGMFTAMQDLKGTETDLDQADAFFGNITLDLSGDKHKGNAHIDERTGLPMSDIDGIIGKTSAGQWSSATNEVFEEEIITDIKCDEAEQKRIAADCLKNGQEFDLETCSCKTKPEDPEDKDIPPYMTFPQDDLRLQNAIDQKWSRNLYMPTRQNVDPVLPDVAYQDPQAMIQANLAMAQQLAKADPANASFYMGQISDKINKGISDVANTNIKIFDNSEARKSQILNDAMATNMANRDQYNTRVATALNNFDNTMIADNANIVDTQVDRMDHADKLYALNMENPNYYYDAQNHMNMFYNPDDLKANKPTEQMTMENARKACKDMGFADGSDEMLACIKQYMGQSALSNKKTRSDIVTNDKEEETKVKNTAESKYGNEVGCSSCDRKQELARSRKALRNWIFGV